MINKIHLHVPIRFEPVYISATHAAVNAYTSDLWLEVAHRFAELTYPWGYAWEDIQLLMAEVAKDVARAALNRPDSAQCRVLHSAAWTKELLQAGCGQNSASSSDDTLLFLLFLSESACSPHPLLPQARTTILAEYWA